MIIISSVRNFVLAVACLAVFVSSVFTQNRNATDRETITKRNAIESELESVATIYRKVMVPMRDGKRMAADIYRPKDNSKQYPIIFSRTPYNFNFWDVRLGAPRDMSANRAWRSSSCPSAKRCSAPPTARWITL